MDLRRNFYASKRSEYRNNYLPFDYYDFWIIAKENENLRFRNKLRDYLHTPFDWDEDQGFYLEPQVDEQHGTQTTSRMTTPRSEELLKRHGKAREGHVVNEMTHKESLIMKHLEERKKEILKKNDEQKETKNKQIVAKQEKSKENKQVIANSNQQQAGSKKKGKKPKKNANQFMRSMKPKAVISENVSNLSKTTTKQSKKFNGNQNSVNGKREIKSATSQTSARQSRTSKRVDDLNESPRLFRSTSSIAIQTPIGWNLREYNKSSRPKSANLVRSTSAVDLKPKRAPFFNYGWATKTKDLSVKPTHNAVANKNLAVMNHDKDAIIELTLQKLKKNAVSIANEYSTIESQVAKHHQTGRSDSRAWNSEYDDKYPDYTKSEQNKKVYYSKSPNRLQKSTLMDDYPALRTLLRNFDALKRGPRSAKSKIYYEK